MERSQENSVLLSTKVKGLEANAVTNPRQFAHEAVATKAFRRQIKTLPSQANAENISNIATFSSAEGLLGRNSEQLISSLQTQYFPPTVPGTGLPMNLPYVGGMIAAPGMDPRTLNAGNLLYTYGAPVMSFPNFSGGYGHVQRGKAPDEAAATAAAAADRNMNSSASSRSMEKVSWCPKEPVRTESVIKTVMDRQESTKKSSDTDKRNISDSGQGLNAPVRYPDKERDVAKLDDRKSKAILRDEQSETNLSRREKQSVVDVDQSRDKTPKAKTFEHLSVDALASKRPNNGPTSRTNENGNLTYSSLSKSYTASEARSSPYLNEPPTLYPYHNALPARSSPNTTNSNVPSSMPKLTPIAPRLNNGSPLTLPHSSEAERRNSSPSGAWRQSYSYTPNSHSSGLSAQGHVRWKGNYFDRPPPVDKTDEVSAWRNKQLSSEDREIDRTASYEHAQNLPDTRRYHPSQSWERPPSFGALRQQVRVADADKPISGKDIQNDSREMLREPIRSSEQIPTTVGKDAFRFGVGPVGFRKETDVASSKLPANLNQEEYQRNQNVASKSIVGEYVRYNTSDDAKGSLGNVIIHGKEGSYKVSVREDKQKYLDCIANGRQTVETVKHTRPEDKDRSFPGNYNDYDAREPKDSSYMAASRAEFKTVKDIKDKEGTDRSRTFDSARYKEQISRKEYAGRKPDSRELTAMMEMRKNNDRNNNSNDNNNNDKNNSNSYGASLGAYSYFKMYETGSAVSSEQARYFNRGAVKDEKVFVPPNATIEMYERREQEMERNGVRNADFNSYAKTVESIRTTNLVDDGSARKRDERRVNSKRDESKPPRAQTGQFEGDRGNEDEELSSDENEDETKMVSNEFASTDKKSQSRRNQTSDRPGVAPQALPMRQHRLSSPSTEHYGGSVHARRPPDVSSDGKLRDASLEAATAASLGMPPSAQFLRMGMDGGALGAPYFSQFLAAPQGRGDAPLLLLDPYGAMYRPHIMEATPQGMFPQGAFAADPVTGSIMMVPEAYIPMMAESQFLLDPRFSGAWGLPGALDDSQLQQLYQMMQPFQHHQHKQQQQQQISERSKQEFFGQQSGSFPWSGYPFFFGKQFESQRKDESNEGKSFDQKQKKREERPEHFDKKVKEATSKPNTERTASQDKTMRMLVPRDGDLGHQQEVSDGGEQKSLGSNWLKETHQKLSEKGSAIQAQLDAQGKIAKQLKDYLLRDPLSQFSFPGSQNVFMKDTPPVTLNGSVTTTSVRTPEVGRQSASPKTVSAAVTLSGLERARDGELQWTARPSSPAKTDARVVSDGSTDVDRVRSPRLPPGIETEEAFEKQPTVKEIAETPQRLEAQPNLAGERSVTRETRQFSPRPDPRHYHEGLLSFGQIASERTVKEKAERELVRRSIESPFCAFERVPPISYGDVSGRAPIQTTVPDSKSRVTDRELALRINLHGAIARPEFDRTEVKTTSLSNNTPKNERAGLQKEIIEPWEDSRESFQLVISSEKPCSPGQFDSDSDFEDDFTTKRELQTIASSFVPVRPDLENKENDEIFSLRPLKSEAERKQIRDNIDRLRSMAKRRNSKDRFMVFSRRKDLRSPTTILNSVTSAISELAGVESVEKEMRMKLAELQKKYREKARELARLQPKCRDGNEDGNGKSTPVKRGPGRPRKRKYFGATSKSGKPSPLRSSSPHTPSGAQSPDANCVPSEPETVLSKESEPPKKKKKAKQKSYGEDEMRSKTPPSRGFSPVEFSDFQVPAGKKKKPSKLSTSEDGGAAVQSRSKQPSGMKKDASSLGKRRKAASPTEINETSTNELESNAEPAAPADANKTAKAKKPRPKKRARPKLTIETAESVEEKADDEIPTDSASTTCDTPRAPSPVKSKKTKVTNKRRKPKVATPTKGKFEFPDVTALEDSFSENSVSPNDIAKEVVAIATRKQQEAQENNRESSSDNDDEVFTSSHDGRDGLSLLATFATAKKPSSTKRKRAGTATTSEDLSPKKRGRPKKPMDSTSFDLDVPVTPKKKKKKKVLEQDQTEEPKKKKKKKKNIHRVENSEEKPVEHREEKKPETTVVEKESEYPEDSPESPPESPTVNREDSEPEGDVYQPIMDLNKDSRRHRSDISTPREPEDSKMNLSSLFCDEWQPRRSERIFINSSVTTNSSTSPLSPTGKGHEFPWSKKSKKGPGMKSKSSKSLSQGEEELGESDVTTPPKLRGKATKKKALVKGKKRSPSNAASCDDYEQLRVSKRARSRSRLTNDFDEGEEEVDEVQEDDDELADEGEVDEEVSSVSEKRETQEERMTEQALLEVNGANQSVEERAKESENQQEDFDMRMELDEGASQKNDKRQASSVGAANVDKLDSSESIDQPQEVNGNPEGCKEDEEMESHIELHNSPSLEDTRFTFVVDELVEGTKLLLPVDSVFFRGHISTFNEPDLFGVVLDGERGRRPHWRSTEQMLSQAIKDIQPPSVQFLPIGTRVCAHWSPQYRCFYPGSVTEAPSDEKEEEGKVWIEFDDGDSGLFQLNEIKRIHPDFPVEEVEATPSLPDKRPRTNSLSSSPAVFNKDLGSKMRSEEIASGFSSGNESSGEMHATRRRLRGKKKNKDDTWVATKRMGNNSEDRGASVRYTHSSTVKDDRISREGTEPLKRKDNKNLSGNNATSQASVVSLDSRQTGNKIRGKTEASSGGKESSRSLEQAKLDMASVTSAELKQSEDEIHSHSSDVSQKRDVCESHAKGSTEKIRAVTDAGTESSDQGEDSEAASDVDGSKRDKGPCARGLLRTSDKDLSKRSLTLSLNSSFRSSRPSGDSPTRDNVSTSQDEDDSESYSDAFDESPLVEMKAFQPRLGRRRRSELDRLQADMKSSGPLWLWSGKNFQNKRKGKGKKIFYKAIVRGDETICVGDCAVFMSNPTKNLNLPYVGRIESMWEGFSGNMVVRVKWFYHPEETKPGRRPSDGRHSLYRSTHVDENDVQTIAHKCEVLTPAEFKRRLQNQDSPGTRASLSDRVFCCIGSYDPNNETLQTEL